jgi:hypothetical protein
MRASSDARRVGARRALARPLSRLALLVLAGLVAALPLAGCRSASSAATLDPLFRAPAGEGRYEVDPSRLGSAPARCGCPPNLSPVVDMPGAPCRHTFGPHGTHPYVDPLTGMPALCAVVRCTKCGEIRHECGLGRIPGRPPAP